MMLITFDDVDNDDNGDVDSDDVNSDDVEDDDIGQMLIMVLVMAMLKMTLFLIMIVLLMIMLKNKNDQPGIGFQVIDVFQQIFGGIFLLNFFSPKFLIFFAKLDPAGMKME